MGTERNEKGKRARIAVVLLPSVVSLVVAAAAVWIGFQHNVQGEFVDTVSGGIDWSYTFCLFAMWFVPTNVLLLAFLWLGGAFVRLKNKVRS
jgi:hypothetical protein